MAFNSLAFAVFFPIVVALYWGVFQRNLRWQNGLLLIASYVFYGWWDVRFLALIFATTLVDYGVGLGLSDPDRPPRVRKALLGASLAANFGSLAFFKYFDFFVESLRDGLLALGIQTDLTTLGIILPVGISFYTFQTVSYSVDVYRGKVEASREPIAFFAFVAFFPQLLAGPIERAGDLLPQFLSRRSYDRELAVDGLRQALWGLSKKVLIADSLAGPIQHAYSHHDTVGGGALILASVFFFVQMYCDFSGYSDIAIGCARILGFRLTRNFAYPFLSRSFTEFWQRWHITLNTWLRDYVFLELEMRTRRAHLDRRRQLPVDQRPPTTPPAWKTAANLGLVFLLSGLWHGAGWTYLLWGVMNGALLVPELLRQRRAALKVVAFDRALPTWTELGQILYVNAMIVATLAVFRSDSLSHALSIYGHVLRSPLTVLSPHISEALVLLCALPLVVEWFQRREEHALAIADKPVWVRWTAYYALIFALLVHGNADPQQFAYFQF